ncbi:hypothetical protein CY34DRAFT_18039 [Suillus luteus UH-Slu-Lm8-n1]|uniref:Uncharacterized protein n=1 Tax=Suillus luteus UH-Slu-Lm8-n1 TaxID=930992 RepID=A0A0D0A739_9AGAM|nr:hypothetical protein CY34DRAFT_18039 [Suillus luteus UH-Slu-Lm8-n1]
MSEGDFGQSEGNCTLSWIWKARGVAVIREDGEAVLSEALRIEWCKSRARANRWWEEQANQRTVLAAPEQEGIEGYVKRQAALRRAMWD